jgi:hypothetical protein
MKMLKMCLNPKVLVALAAVGFGVYVLAPGAFAAALPLLLLAACPLSMLLMMAMMGRGNSGGHPQEGGAHEDPHEELVALQARERELLAQLDRRKDGAPVS